MSHRASPGTRPGFRPPQAHAPRGHGAARPRPSGEARRRLAGAAASPPAPESGPLRRARRRGAPAWAQGSCRTGPCAGERAARAPRADGSRFAASDRADRRTRDPSCRVPPARALKIETMASHSRGVSWAPLMRGRSVPAVSTSSAQPGVASAASGAVTMMYTWRPAGRGPNNVWVFWCRSASACVLSSGSAATVGSPGWRASQPHKRSSVSRTCPSHRPREDSPSPASSNWSGRISGLRNPR